jgi:Hypoxia induced protein conserved region
MPSLPSTVVAIAILAVATVLVLGFLNLLRQGAGNTSQTLMRWRVGLQFLAILLVVVVLLARGHPMH